MDSGFIVENRLLDLRYMIGLIGQIGLIGLIGRIKAALIGIAFFEAFFDKGEYLVVAEIEPGFGDKIARWNFAGEALDNDVWVKPFDEVDDEFNIIFECKQVKIRWIGEIFVGHFCIFEYLELMKFHCC